MADLAGDIDVRQEVHLDLHEAVAAAGLAAAALDVEGEAARPVAPHLGIGCGRKQIPDVIEKPGIGGRVGAGGSADGALVDINHLIQGLYALDAAAASGAGTGMV